jgi:hypothetical protein
VSASTPLTELPVQRPRAVKGAPVLILSSHHRKGLQVWDGRYGKVAGYAGDMLAVTVPGKIVEVLADSWALVGDSSGAGRRPRIGDLVICQDGTLGTVAAGMGTDGDVLVEADGQTSCRSWWASVLSGI